MRMTWAMSSQSVFTKGNKQRVALIVWHLGQQYGCGVQVFGMVMHLVDFTFCVYGTLLFAMCEETHNLKLKSVYILQCA